MPKESLKDKVEGNELDLSLSELTVVPVKELAAIPKATSLDLSCNLLTTLPDEFSRLSHLVIVDLSKNKLQCLPDKFGLLPKLQHLDLFSNCLTTLPLSFQHARALKWLDVKDNPLEEPLKSRVGDCLDNTQCKQCALTVVSLMKQIESTMERERHTRLTEEKALKAAEQAEHVQTARAEKERKLAEKEARRRAYEETRAAEHDEMKSSATTTPAAGGDDSVHDAGDMASAHSTEIGGGVLSCTVLLFTLFVAVFTVMLTSYLACHDSQRELCVDGHRLLQSYQHRILVFYDSMFNKNSSSTLVS